MQIKIILFLVCSFALLGVLFFSKHESSRVPASDLQSLSLAFDWTPNTNHTGIYVALHEGWYMQEGIDLRILPYSDTVLPDVLVNSGAADVGISSPEAIVTDSAVGAPVISIAAINAHNTSSLAVRADSSITRPTELDGKVYGGFGASYEVPVITTIITTDGGRGDFKNITLGVDALEALRAGRVDFAWIFDGWQGIQAAREGLELRTFPIRDHGIPDYATPNIVTSLSTLENKRELLRAFLRVTARGYEYARTHPKESAKMLLDSTPPGTFADAELIFESQEYMSQQYADLGVPWGLHDASSWHKYVLFMLTRRAVFDATGKPINTIDSDSLFTNELLP